MRAGGCGEVWWRGVSNWSALPLLQPIPLETDPKGSPSPKTGALAHPQVDEVKIAPQEACEKAKA